MGRSLFRKLHRRFGTRRSGVDRKRRADAHHERARDAMPLGVVKAKPATGKSPGRVAIIGAGFAGCAAAYVANLLGFKVTIYDAGGEPGGRVTSSRTVVPGRILETGGELIGLNHPLWILCADRAGFALGVVTPDDDYAGAMLDAPLILGGVAYNQKAQAQLYAGMQKVFNGWIKKSAIVTAPWTPWQTPNAARLDSQNLGEKIPTGTHRRVIKAIEAEFELNNTIPIGQQSWLANLAQFQAAGGDQGFFDDTEVFRCTAGNQQLAFWLTNGLSLVRQTVTAIDTSRKVTLTFKEGGASEPFDYVIVATSVAIWPSIRVDGKEFPYQGVNNGPAVKYLAPVEQRFWIPESLAPSGMSDTLGMTWEGTDNQANTAGFDLSVFAGGKAAQNAINNQGSDSYYAALISQLYPGFSTSGGRFHSHASDPNILTGYACPGPNQVTGAQQSYSKPYQERLFVAGEHTSPAWFGFMEGALESGLIAAARVARVAGVRLRPEWGGTKAL
jgi:monoamine oxidase